jgi:hypothetical protein
MAATACASLARGVRMTLIAGLRRRRIAVKRKTAAALLAGLVAAACGGGGASSPTMPTSNGGEITKLLVLDAGNFDALVLAAPRTSLVEFQSPT